MRGLDVPVTSAPQSPPNCTGRPTCRSSSSGRRRIATTSQPAIARYEAGQARPRLATAQRCVDACGFELRIELERTSAQRRAAAEAALARSVEDRLRSNDSFTRFAAELRRG